MAPLPLHEAVKRNDAARVTQLLKQRVKINAKDKFGSSALIWCADKGNTEIGELLIGKGADIEMANHLGETALIISSSQGRYDFVRLLIRYGAELEPICGKGKTALDWAREMKHFKIAALLQNTLNDRASAARANTASSVNSNNSTSPPASLIAAARNTARDSILMEATESKEEAEKRAQVAESKVVKLEARVAVLETGLKNIVDNLQTCVSETS